MPEPAKQLQPLSLVGGVAGAIGGWTLSQYCGAYIWLPGIAAVVFLLIFAKTPVRPPYFAGAIAITAAHVAWFVAGSAVTGAWLDTALDIVALTAAIVWLWTRPGPAAVLFLGVVQGLSLVWNAYQLAAAPFGSAPHRALTAHCVLRSVALLCLAGGYFQWRRAQRSTPPPLPGTAVP